METLTEPAGSTLFLGIELGAKDKCIVFNKCLIAGNNVPLMSLSSSSPTTSPPPSPASGAR